MGRGGSHPRVAPKPRPKAVPALWRAPPGESPPTLSLSHSKKHSPIVQTRVLALGCWDFPSLCQPINLAEIWCKSSPVCDSFTHPIRILNCNIPKLWNVKNHKKLKLLTRKENFWESYKRKYQTKRKLKRIKYYNLFKSILDFQMFQTYYLF